MVKSIPGLNEYVIHLNGSDGEDVVCVVIEYYKHVIVTAEASRHITKRSFQQQVEKRIGSPGSWEIRKDHGYYSAHRVKTSCSDVQEGTK